MEERILTFDQGNSSAKLTAFACRKGESPRIVVTRRFEKIPTIEEVAELIDELNLTGGIYCTVGHLDVRFVETLRGLLSGGLIILTHSTPLPVEVEYSTPATLGLDRVAAAVGACLTVGGKSAVVVDAGTAITEDLVCVNERGVATFKGGRISPGLSMRFKALHSYTSCLPIVKPDGKCPVAGSSTEESIRSGVVRGVVAEIKGVWDEYSKLDDASHPVMVLTGGDAQFIADHLDIPAIVAPQLNDIGLCAIYMYNQSAKFA